MGSELFFAIIGLVFMWIVLHSVRKKRFFEKYSFYWFLLACAMLLLSIFPYTIKRFAAAVEVEYAPSLLFLVAIVFMLGIIFNLTQQVGLLREQNKDLAQSMAVLQSRVKDLEDEVNN